MTVSTWLNHAIDQLESAGVATARLDSQLLLADELKQDRSWLMAHLDTTLSDDTVADLTRLIDQRMQHVPLAYIRGKTEFYGREFMIDKRVLEPRPETETMIDILKGLPPANEPLQIIDVGTGSGALAITAKLELPNAEVVATDIDPGCLAVAEANAHKHQVDITFSHGDLLEPVHIENKRIVITLANLPYVPDSHTINKAAMFEPKIAIFGGEDGLDQYRKLFQQASELSKRPAYILTEALPPQHKQLAFIAARFGFLQTAQDNFIQVFEGGHQQGVAYGTDTF